MKDPSPLTPDDIQIQLNRIFTSSQFRSSEKQRHFLNYVIDETLEGREDQIKGYTVAVAVYGRKADFDPQVDPIVRVEAGRLRRALEHYYLTDGIEDPIRIEIPKGGYVPQFITALDNASESGELFSPSGREFVDRGPSIAVLPMDNLSGDDSRDYFAEGLTEELTAELARYQELHVIASQSTMQFRDQGIDPRIIGRKLAVRFLLAGSVRNDGETIKISTRLIDTTNNAQIWTASYGREMTPASLIELQEEIAQNTVGALADQFGQISRELSKESRKKPPKDLAAYDAILRFYHYESVLTPDSFQEALTAMEKAVAIDPEYGLAWAVLAHLHADNHALGFCEIEKPLEKALKFALKGLALEPSNQFVHDALTLVYFHRGDKVPFLKHLDTTLALNPNAPYIIGVAGWHLALYGEWDRGLSLLQKGMQLNPYHPTWFYLATFMDCYHRADYEAAYVEALKFNYPTLFWDPLMRAAALAQLDDAHEAKKALKELIALLPDFESGGRQLMGNYVKLPELVEGLASGLQKAGMANLS